MIHAEAKKGHLCSPPQGRRPVAGGRADGRCGRDCIEVMHQLAAAQAAIGKACEVIVQSHLETFVADTLQSGTEQDQRRRGGAS